MKLSILLRTSHFRGDHEAEVTNAHDLKPGETVEQLAERLLTESVYKQASKPRLHDWIEIRIVSDVSP